MGVYFADTGILGPTSPVEPTHPTRWGISGPTILGGIGARLGCLCGRDLSHVPDRPAARPGSASDWLYLERFAPSFISKGSRSCFLAKLFFGGLGYQGRKTILYPGTSGLLALPPKAARPTKRFVLENVWVFGPGTPSLNKKHLANKPLRDPFDIGPGKVSKGFN